MHCENNMCVYNDEENGCIFDEISINSLGMCEDFILLTLEEEEREKIRDKMLKEFLERENDI